MRHERALLAFEDYGVQLQTLQRKPINDDLFICFQVWSQLGQVAPSWVKLILVGLFCPLVGQEFTEGFAIILVSRYPEQDILHPFTRVNVQCFAAAHQGVNDGGTYCSVVTYSQILPRPDLSLYLHCHLRVLFQVLHLESRLGFQAMRL